MEAKLCLRIPDSWTTASLEELCQRVTSGGTPSRANPAYYIGGRHLWVKTVELKDGWIESTEERITSEALTESSAKLLPPNTVLVAMYGATVGQLGILRYEGACNQACCALISDPEKIDFRYLFYQLLHHKAQIKRMAVGSAQQNISAQLLRSFRIPVPPLSAQKAIATILGVLDDKIELNRRMNKTLEAMAQALFKSWFVDFDPVRAKMEGRWKRGESLPGLPAHLYDLFPDRLVDSELGEIPEGWEVAPLPNVVEVNPNRPLRKGETAPYLDMANMPTRGHTPNEVISRPFGSGMRFVNGDTLVARITPCLENGKTAYVDFLEDGQVGWGSTEYIVLRPKPPLPNEFAHCLARSDTFREFAIQSMVGSSGRQRVQVDSLLHYRIAMPSQQVADMFKKVIQPLFASAKSSAKESRTLAALRDSLLPKLISGEVRLKDTKRLIAEAVP